MLQPTSLAESHGHAESHSPAWDFVASTAPVTRNGPYGQADWVRSDAGQRPFKDIVPSGTRYGANNGGAFADVLLRRAFGYDPAGLVSVQPNASDRPPLWRAGAKRGFTGRLHGVRLPNGAHADVCAGEAGVRYC